MSLSQALHILASTHTRDDDVTGFVVLAGAKYEPYSQFSQADYIEAWKTVREHAHMQTEPGK